MLAECNAKQVLEWTLCMETRKLCETVWKQTLRIIKLIQWGQWFCNFFAYVYAFSFNAFDFSESFYRIQCVSDGYINWMMLRLRDCWETHVSDVNVQFFH